MSDFWKKVKEWLFGKKDAISDECKKVYESPPKPVEKKEIILNDVNRKPRVRKRGRPKKNGK